MSFAGGLHPIPILCSASPAPKPRRNPNPLLPLPPTLLSAFPRRLHLPNCPSPSVRRRSSTRESPPEPVSEVEEKEGDSGHVVERMGGRVSISDWATSALLFGFYVAVLYYVIRLSPDQTPSRDMYFLKKLLNLKGDDGFRMNEVLVSLWYLMGLWPILYSMLLIPTGRSSKGSVPVWPFLSLSFFFGAYALIPYFILWKPPPPPVEEEEISLWPLKFLESKITAGIALAAGLGLIVYAGLADGAVWKEFSQYFRESKLVHVTSVDFTLLSAFSTFWVYNDMTARRFDKGKWFLPFTVIPVVGPALYLLLRPSLSALPISMITNKEDKTQ